MSVAALAPAAGERPRTTTLFDVLEIAAVVLVLFWLTEAWATVLVGNDPAAPVDNDQLRRFWLPTYGLMLVLAASRPAQYGTLWLGIALGLPIVALAFASTQWSIAPDITLRRSITLALTTFFGFYLAARFSWRTLIEMAAAALVISAAGSLVAAVAFPSFGVNHTIHPGAWQGLFSEKNTLGATMVRGALAAGCAAVLVPERRWLWVGGALLCAAMTIASTSTTALLGLLVVMASFPAVAALRSRGAAAVAAVWLAFAAVVVGLGVFIFVPEIFFEAVGKDATLTGRTEIWELVGQKIRERPTLGYGFAAFWADKDYGPAAAISEQLDWSIPTAHNGWLETMLQFGMVGLVLVAVHFGIALLAGIARLPMQADGWWSAPYLVVFLLFSLSESSIVQQTSIFWVLYVATTAKMLQFPVHEPRAPRTPHTAYEETRLG
jgi:O-antigen ligase